MDQEDTASRVTGMGEHQPLLSDIFSLASVSPATATRLMPNTVILLKRDKDVEIACADNLSFMRPLHDGSQQLIVTSPPYNIGKSY